jgi:hypothetical protein
VQPQPPAGSCHARGLFAEPDRKRTAGATNPAVTRRTSRARSAASAGRAPCARVIDDRAGEARQQQPSLTLARAQSLIAVDWIAAYKR